MDPALPPRQIALSVPLADAYFPYIQLVAPEKSFPPEELARWRAFKEQVSAPSPRPVQETAAATREGEKVDVGESAGANGTAEGQATVVEEAMQALEGGAQAGSGESQ